MKVRYAAGIVSVTRARSLLRVGARAVVAVALAGCAGGDAGGSEIGGGAPNAGASGDPSTPGSGEGPAPLPAVTDADRAPLGSEVTPGIPLAPSASAGDPNGEAPTGEPPSSEPPLVDSPASPGPSRLDGAELGAPNVFRNVLGRTPAEVDAKLVGAVNRFFGIGTNDPATPTVNGGARLYYELPQDPSMAFIWAPDTADIRSEGMSYGMFIAVQMDLREQFDRLWRFARTFMQHPADGPVPAWRHYFKWTGTVSTSNPNEWQVSFAADTAPASDGEEYFAAALYLADRRWGSSGEIDYEGAADAITDAMLNNPAGDARYPLFHRGANMVVFAPIGTANDFSNPSYHLPAFYELFAEDGPARDRERWLAIAETSREYFVRSAHGGTGLHPNYAAFDGTPTQGTEPSLHDTFRFDAWRVPLNMAIDYAWGSGDARLKAQSEKYHAFFESHLSDGNVVNSRFNLDGSGGTGGPGAGLVATLAAGALASEHPSRGTYLSYLWSLAQPTGEFRYYHGSLYLLGLLAASGRFDYAFTD